MNTLLNRVGEALYGDRWQSSLARALGVSDRTMRRWVSGQKMPSDVWRDIFIRLDLARDTVNFLIDRVKDEIDSGGKK